MSWIIYNIEPNLFNVISDLFALAISTLFTVVLGYIYPYIVWDSVKRGRPVHIGGILEPPTLLDSFRLFRNKKNGHGQLPSMSIVLAVPVIVLIAFLAHAAADSYLDFESVPIGVRDTFFLSSEPGGVPTHGLLTDHFPRLCNTETIPSLSAVRLLQESDLIARGASRFSLFPPERMDCNKSMVLDGKYSLYQFSMNLQGDPSVGVSTIPERLGVECKSPYEKTNSSTHDGVPTIYDDAFYPDGKNAMQTLITVHTVGQMTQ